MKNSSKRYHSIGKFILMGFVSIGMVVGYAEAQEATNVLNGAAAAVDAVNKASSTAQAASDSINAVGAAVSGVSQATMGGTDLVGLLSSQLGVTQDQALGGGGAIFQYMKDQVTPEQFSDIAAGVPNLSEFLNAVPAVSGRAPGVGGALSMLGGEGSGLSKLVGLNEAFSSLGLNTEMVQQFVPIMSTYFKSSGSQTAASLLTSLF